MRACRKIVFSLSIILIIYIYMYYIDLSIDRAYIYIYAMYICIYTRLLLYNCCMSSAIYIYIVDINLHALN